MLSSTRRILELLFFSASLILSGMNPAWAQPWPDSEVDAIRRSSNLAREAQLLVPDPARALVIPESAFLAAMAEARKIATDPVIQNRGRQLGALGNDRSALGILAPITYGHGSVPFSGNAFIVVRNPTLLRGNRGIEASDYYVALVELRGISPWVGGNARVVLGSRSGPMGNVCCGKTMTCVTPPPSNGPCGPDSFCNPPDAGVTNTGNPNLDARADAGMPLIGVQLYGAGFTGDPQACVQTVNPGCGVVKPVCGPDDEGFTLNQDNTVDVPVGSSACGNFTRPATFSEVPLICQMALTTGEGPFCGGLTNHNPPAIAESFDGIPPGCRVARTIEGSNMCLRPHEQQNLRALEQLALRAQFVGGTGSRCQLQGNGVRFCTTCTAESCTQTAERTHSLVAGEQPQATKVNFDEPTTILGKCKDANGAEITCGKTQAKDEPAGAQQPANPPPAAPAATPPATTPPATPAQPQNNDPPPPGPEKPKKADSNDRGPREFFPEPPSQGDPIAVGSGALLVEVTDLHFEGPARPLEFRRSYSSQSDVRSALGSNWVHNWDVRVDAITLANADSWMLPYCAGSATRASCVALKRGDGFSELFYLDYGTMLYMPQAGSTTTIVQTANGGWAARSPDGRVQVFDTNGMLTDDRDRFGNGFTLSYEPTPLGRAFNALCDPMALASRNETLASRRCAVLAFMVGKAQRPLPGDAWNVTAADFATLLAQLPTGAAANAEIAYGVDYLLSLIALGPTAEPADDGRPSRLSQVTDDVGRTLLFQYAQATNGAAGTRDFSAAQVERLITVRGPTGTQITFEYGRPIDYSAGANESFLVRVSRHDTPAEVGVTAAPDRETRYQYEWPGAPADSYTASRYQDDITLASEVYDSYFAYYRSFIGCAGKISNGCGTELGLPGIVPGDPSVLARIKQNEYIGRVADNIVTVTADGAIESETRYEPNPWEANFDHARAQRYGSAVAVAAPGPIAPDVAADRWQTQLPKAVFDYVSAGPRSPIGDLTANFLPAEIRSRYPLDTAQDDTTVADPQEAPFSSAVEPAPEIATAQLPVCSAEQSKTLFQALPGWRRSTDYYEAAPPTTPVAPSGRIALGSIRIMRTRLSCDALAVNQLGDPAHNDLASSLTPDLSTPNILSDHFATRITGRRSVIALDVNRVCGWTRSTDRDGDVRYFGLNYRGQALVEARARRKQPGFVFSEYIYNADGLIVEERRPTTGTAAWTLNAGLTAVRYDEIDPSANRGWDGWLPAFWARRANALRIETLAAGGNVVDLDEATGAPTVSAGRYQAFRYEPLFNQLAQQQTGALVRQGTTLVDVPATTTDTLFDFQEPSTLDSSFASLLDSLRPWGYNWLTLANGDYDYAGIASFQLPIQFYGQDLNSDGVTGFGFAPTGTLKVRSVAMRIEQRGSNPGPVSVSTFVWAPHGLPSQVTGPDGESTVYRFYKSGDPTSNPQSRFGSGSVAGATQASRANSGFVAEVRRARYGLSYPAASGPNSAPCPQLRGPFQWLLPSTCNNVPLELAALGLPAATVNAVLASSDSQSDDRWRSAVASYTSLGQPRFVWSEGRTTQFGRDTDGRVLESIDPLGNVQQIQYSTRGLPVSESWRDAANALLSYRRAEFDSEGRPVRSCIALEAGGCTQPGTGTPQQEAISIARFNPEGQLANTVDPEGLITAFEYDEAAHVTAIQLRGRRVTRNSRNARFQYDVDGKLVEAQYGTSTTANVRESVTYDGLQRPTRETDRRGMRWYNGYSRRDLLVRRKLDVRAFGVAGAAPTWETAAEYDSLGRLVLRRENGTEVERYELTAGGLPARTYRLGRGVVQSTFDLEGRTAWTVDGTGTQQVFTLRPQALERTHAVLRRCCDPVRRLNTATLERLDVLGRAIEVRNWGAGEEQRFQFARDGLGNVREQTDSQGIQTRFERNLVGWPRRVLQQRTASPPIAFDVSTYDYDREGRTKRVVDPANQATQYAYTVFGELGVVDRPGSLPARRRFEYDALGRVYAEENAGVRIQYQYDSRGDRVTDRLMGVRGEVIATHAYDELGRVREATESNPALSWLPRAQRVVTTGYRYDSLGRLRAESSRIANQVPRTVTYTWSLNGATLRRDAAGPPSSQLRWTELFDAAGRLARKEWDGAGGQAASSFSWLGGALAARDTRDGARPSPFNEVRALDNFGATVGWEYRGIRLDGAGRPLDAAEGRDYCGPTWVMATCGVPLLSIAILRDTQQRALSTQTRFGAPVFNGTVLANVPQRAPWRGVEYTPLGAIENVWEHLGVGRAISTGGLRTNNVTGADVAALGGAGGASPWNYRRQAAVGDLEQISDPNTGADRWEHVGAYSAGHQVSRVRIGGQAGVVSFDANLRVARYGNRTFAYDPRGSLAHVDTAGVLSEAYFHDAQGRVVRSLRNVSGSLYTDYLYDGQQMIAAFNPNGSRAWSAVWGPDVDQMLEWTDAGGARWQPLADDRNSVVAAWRTDIARLTDTVEYSPEGRISVRDATGVVTCTESAPGSVCALPAQLPFGLFSAFRSTTSGLVYLRNRWYSPELAQFLSPDANGYEDSFNPYAFAGFDPISGRDPFGLSAAQPLFPQWWEPVTELPRPPLRLLPNPPPAGTPGYAPRSPMMPQFLRFLATVVTPRLLGAVAFLAPSNLFQQHGSCNDGICKPYDQPNGWDQKTGQPITPEEMDARQSLPRDTTQASKKNPDYKPSDYSGDNHKGKVTRPDSDPDVCAYCGQVTSETIEHIIARVDWYKLFKDEGLTEKEAKDGADDIVNLIRACRQCNSSKSSKLLGVEWNPKNPSDLVKKLIKLMKNPNTRWILRNLANVRHPGVAVGAGIGLAGASTPSRAATPGNTSAPSGQPSGGSSPNSCQPKDFSCH